MIKSISYSTKEILENILELYARERGIDCDLTYCRGGMYKFLDIEPKFKFDKYPRVPGIISADSRQLPIADNSFKTVVFDPPFLISSNNNGIMAKKYGCFKTYIEMIEYIELSLKEIKRILKTYGILIFKCQDTIDGRVNYFTHVDVINVARAIGFKNIDIFIYVSKNRLKIKSIIKQRHARKFHSYFIVFRKVSIKHYRKKHTGSAGLAVSRSVSTGCEELCNSLSVSTGSAETAVNQSEMKAIKKLLLEEK